MKWTADPGLATKIAAPIVVVLGGLVLLLVVRGRRMERAAVLEVGVLLTLIPLVSPLGWDYQLLTSVLAVTLVAHHWTAFSRAARFLLAADLALVGFSIYDVIGRTGYRTFMAWSVLTLCFLVVLVYGASLRAREIA